MFTGLIQGVGTLIAREALAGDARLRIGVGTLPFDEVQLGESIAVNGVCLTVAAYDAEGFQADASPETLALTTLGELPPGRTLNLERALRPLDRLGGHLVSGHVDGIGTVTAVRADARAQRWRIEADKPLLRYVAYKGSICVDGVSLTVNAVNDSGFEVALVPHTVAYTAFAQTGVGDAVNLEVDLVARYV
ncbi:MAG: riboflavin synthase, partial [Gammaproteobacteria bacterium]|nr:riboflavin synthase [Gammaproteobacteria bacterium]